MKANHPRSVGRLAQIVLLSLGVAGVFFVCLLFILVQKEQQPEAASSKYERHFVLHSSRVIQRLPSLRTVAVQYRNDSAFGPPVPLPNFAVDKSEFIFSSLIERSQKSSLDLHITTILLSHAYLRMPDLELRKVRAAHRADWRQAAKSFAATRYHPSGRRRYAYEDRFSCRIAHSNRSASYVVSGEFVPNRASSSIVSNRRFDILRCPMLVQRLDDLQGYIAADDSLSVEICRGQEAIISFTVPWRARGAGYLLDAAPNANRHDPWQGIEWNPAVSAVNDTRSGANSSLPAVPLEVRKIHLCVPCMKKALSKDNIPLVLEFIAHHLNIGFDHISLSTSWHWTSVHHQHLVKLLAAYIREGKVSISSLAQQPLPEGEEAPQFEVQGMAFFRVFMATLQSNLCLYMSKGVADFMASLDIDEFLVPTYSSGKLTLRSIIQNNSLLMDEDSVFAVYRDKLLAPKWTTGPGWADNHQHPYCYLGISTEVVLPKRRTGDVLKGWLGVDFGHGVEDNSTLSNVLHMREVVHSLIPVDRIFYSALQVPGSCALPWLWNGCHSSKVDICLDADGRVEPADADGGMQAQHTFDERVTAGDARALDKDTLVVYHFRYFAAGTGSTAASKSAVKARNTYSELWHAEARRELELRGLDLFLELPSVDTTFSVPPPKALSKLMTDSSDDKKQFEINDDAGVLDGDEHSRIVEEALSTSLHEVVQLPRFAADHSEFVMTSMIERAADAWDLTISTFLLCHHVVVPQENHNQHVVLSVHPKAVPAWQQAITQFEKTSYNSIGLRKGHDKFQCRLKNMVSELHNEHTHDELAYTADAAFVPSRASMDYNANLRMDILRCPMSNNMFNHIQYAGKPDISVEVEILKNGVSLIKFHIPWQTRITGYMAFSPQSIKDWQKIDEEDGSDDKGSRIEREKTYSSSSSTAIAEAYAHNVRSVKDKTLDSIVYALPSLSIDPWNGFNRGHLGVWKLDKVYMCVPGLRSTPSIRFLAHLYEFVQHHLMMGVGHIVLGATFSWRSPTMKLLLRVLKNFIQDGKVSVASHSPDDVDFRFALGGMSARHTPMKVVAVNICMYYAKGMADYVAIWDIDEFFIPLGENRDLLSLIDKMDPVEEIDYPYDVNTDLTTLQKSWNPDQKGMASNQGHPFCYMQLYSTSYYCFKGVKYSDPGNLWFRANYRPTDSGKLAHKKGIHSTRKAFYITLHLGGACRLPQQWTDCKEERVELCSKGIDPPPSFRITHNFDEKVTAIDVKHVNKSTEAVIYHVQFFRWHMKSENEHSLEENRYAQMYSDVVLQELDKRGLYLPLQLLHKNEFFEADAAVTGVGSSSAPVSEAHSAVNSLPLLSSDHSVLFVSSMLAKAYDGSDPDHDLSLLTFVGFHNFLVSPSGSSQTAGRALNEVKSKITSWLSSMGSVNSSSGNHKTDCPVKFSSIICSFSNNSVTVVGKYFALARSFGFLSCPMPDGVINGGDLHPKISFMVTLPTGYSHQQSVEFVLDNQWIGTGLVFPSASAMHVHPQLAAEAVEEDRRLYNHSIALLAGQHALQRAVLLEKQEVSGGVHLCAVSEWTGPTSRMRLPLLLEFIQHHLLLGVKRIYLPVAHQWGSKDMLMLAAVLRTYLIEGSVVLLSTVGQITEQSLNRQNVMNLSGELRTKYIATICALHASNAQADYLAMWEVHQFFVPRTANQRSIADAMQWRTDKRNVAMPIAQMAVSDYGANYFAHNQAQGQRAWLGDIYHRTPGLVQRVDDSSQSASLMIGGQIWSKSVYWENAFKECQDEPKGYAGVDWHKSNAIQWMGKVWVENESSSMETGHGAVLYDFYHIDHRNVHCTESVANSKESIQVEFMGELERSSYLRQMHSLCAWFDAGERIAMLQDNPDEEGAATSNSSVQTNLQSNLYRQFFFANVYHALVERNLDLFVDSIPRLGPELSESHILADANYVDYFSVYKSNKHSKMKLVNFTVV